jgi:hypothetical protein
MHWPWGPCYLFIQVTYDLLRWMWLLNVGWGSTLRVDLPLNPWHLYSSWGRGSSLRSLCFKCRSRNRSRWWSWCRSDMFIFVTLEALEFFIYKDTCQCFFAPARNRVVMIACFNSEMVSQTTEQTMIYHGSGPSLKVIALRLAVWYWRWT